MSRMGKGVVGLGADGLAADEKVGFGIFSGADLFCGLVLLVGLGGLEVILGMSREKY